MNIEEEKIKPVPIRKVKKSTRTRKSTRVIDAQPESTDLTDRILIKKTARTKVRPVQHQMKSEDSHRTYAAPQVSLHTKKVRAFITTICTAAILAFIVSEYYMTSLALHQANVRISELTYIINNSATTIVSDELDPKQKILQDIGKRMELPTGEEPTVVLIEDAERASKEQAFYSQVITGDVVVIYPNARKAIIWSPSRMKVINAGVVDIQLPQTEDKAEAEEITSTTKQEATQ